jgi:hypothetical protein
MSDYSSLPSYRAALNQAYPRSTRQSSPSPEYTGGADQRIVGAKHSHLPKPPARFRMELPASRVKRYERWLANDTITGSGSPPFVEGC